MFCLSKLIFSSDTKDYYDNILVVISVLCREVAVSCLFEDPFSRKYNLKCFVYCSR